MSETSKEAKAILDKLDAELAPQAIALPKPMLYHYTSYETCLNVYRIALQRCLERGKGI